MSLTIAEICDADIQAIVDLWTRAGITRPWNDPVKDIAFARSAPHATVLVGRDEGVVAASAMVGEDGHRGWVYYVAIAPEQQGKGLGRTIMQAAESWLKARGIWKMQLLVRGDNAQARGFYENLGFALHDTVLFQKTID